MIRQAKYNDLPEIVNIYKVCFYDHFSGQLSNKLLSRFFCEYLKKVPELFLIDINLSNNIVGFCMGYYCDSNNYIHEFVKNSKFLIALHMVKLLTLLNKYAWRKVFALVKNKERVIKSLPHNYGLTECGDLLSIGVIPTERGNGESKKLLNAYEKALTEHGRKACMLSTTIDNKRAIKFYSSNGYVVYKQTTKCLFFIKGLCKK